MQAGERRIKLCFPFCGDLIGGSHISVLGPAAQPRPAALRPCGTGRGAGRRDRAADAGGGRRGRRRPVLCPALRHGQRAGLHDAIGIARASRHAGAAAARRRSTIVHSNDGRTHATWALPAKLAGAKLVWHHRGAPNARGLALRCAARRRRESSPVSAFALGGAASAQAA